jgi:K(+)-stimulated pyrophosphate-energized sodium pump
MVLPGLMAVVVPTLVGYIGGAEMLGGLLAGVTVSGVLMAIFQSNAGGAWDNAKKMIEEGVTINGVTYNKGSEAHKATVVGDTVGDPFKDTSGPSLNILLKLMSVVALVIAPSIAINLDANKTDTQIESIVNVDANNDFEVSANTFVMDTIVNQTDTVVDENGNISIQQTVKIKKSEIQEGISGKNSEKNE